MPISFTIKIDFDNLETYDDWGTAVGEVIKHEIELAIKTEVKKALKKDGSVAKAVKMLKDCAVEKIAREMGISQ